MSYIMTNTKYRLCLNGGKFTVRHYTSSTSPTHLVNSFLFDSKRKTWVLNFLSTGFELGYFLWFFCLFVFFFTLGLYLTILRDVISGNHTTSHHLKHRNCQKRTYFLQFHLIETVLMGHILTELKGIGRILKLLLALELKLELKFIKLRRYFIIVNYN